jgi:hypothetical protein
MADRRWGSKPGWHVFLVAASLQTLQGMGSVPRPKRVGEGELEKLEEVGKIRGQGQAEGRRVALSPTALGISFPLVSFDPQNNIVVDVFLFLQMEQHCAHSDPKQLSSALGFCCRLEAVRFALRPEHTGIAHPWPGLR